jgi:hypothetical protein
VRGRCVFRLVFLRSVAFGFILQLGEFVILLLRE